MSPETILDMITFNQLSMKDAKVKLMESSNKKLLNYFINRDKITKEPMKESELSQLNSIVNILQALYNSEHDSPISDTEYETLQEMLIDSGIPRLVSDNQINDMKKQEHSYQQLRGSLNKIHYLTKGEIATNPSRKYLDDWIKSAEAKYQKATGKSINLNDETVICQCKFDGASAVLEIDSTGKCVWLTRGDTNNNLATDVTHILRQFNDLYSHQTNHGIKFEIMCTEEDKDKINELYREKNYRNSRQVVTATLNSKEADFKANYLYPVPLRVMSKEDNVEHIHPDLMRDFPNLTCRLSDREKIKEFGQQNKVVKRNGLSFRTDGVVITLTNPEVQRILARENNISMFDVAFKFTEEVAYSRVRSIEFETSQFGFIVPVLVIDNVILKGNTIQRCSLSNKERFDELGLCRDDMIEIRYDIIPYATITEKCKRSGKSRIEFPSYCPSCGSLLDLDVVQVQCHNKDCLPIVIGRMLNWCENLRIHDLGYQTLETLYRDGLLKNGIRSLYKLKNKQLDMEDLPGFGRLKTRKILREIESKRRLKDFEFIGSLGIEGLSLKTFETIFQEIPYMTFLELMPSRSLSSLYDLLVGIKSIGEKKAELLVDYLRDGANRKEIDKLRNELSVEQTFGQKLGLKQMAFTGIRPDKQLQLELESHGWSSDYNLTKKSMYLVVPEDGHESTKTKKAQTMKIPIITIDFLRTNITNLKKGG